MFTDRVDASEEELRTDPVGSGALAPAHQFLQSAAGSEGFVLRAGCKNRAARFDYDERGLRRGRRRVSPAHIFGWMVHVYPYEADAKRIWSTDDDDADHDNMDHSAMPGMKTN